MVRRPAPPTGKGSKAPVNDSMLREQNKRTLLPVVWAALICCVVIGYLQPRPSFLPFDFCLLLAPV
jgi:hypothetical protein